MEYIPVIFDIETTGLNPLAQSWSNWHDHDGQVLAVGVATVGGWQGPLDGVDIDVEVLVGKNEYGLLMDVRDYMLGLCGELESYKGFSDGVPDGEYITAESTESREAEIFLVGWNSRQFDHQYLCARFARLRQDPFPFAWRRKRLDGMRVVKKNTGKYRSQDDYYEELGHESEDEWEGSDIPDLWEEREMWAIEEHAEHDVRELAQIFVERREWMMGEFYDHYDIDQEVSFGGGVDL